ncbi:MAG: hypothetical protein FD175_1379 [Beijerinckiaceae bacterium]|nr:MAG: hypothetical protein FD175_1379 [Beijerinckiaceae bacterium]
MSILGVLAATIAAWGFGAAYYGALGTIWLDAIAFRPEERAKIETGGKMDPTPFILAFVAELLMAIVLSGLMLHFAPPSLVKGAMIGITIWLGFVAAPMIVNNAYAMRSLRLTAIDAGHWLGVLIILGAVIGGVG